MLGFVACIKKEIRPSLKTKRLLLGGIARTAFSFVRGWFLIYQNPKTITKIAAENRIKATKRMWFSSILYPSIA